PDFREPIQIRPRIQPHPLDCVLLERQPLEPPVGRSGPADEFFIYTSDSARPRSATRYRPVQTFEKPYSSGRGFNHTSTGYFMAFLHGWLRHSRAGGA